MFRTQVISRIKNIKSKCPNILLSIPFVNYFNNKIGKYLTQQSFTCTKQARTQKFSRAGEVS